MFQKEPQVNRWLCQSPPVKTNQVSSEKDENGARQLQQRGVQIKRCDQKKPQAGQVTIIVYFAVESGRRFCFVVF